MKSSVPKAILNERREVDGSYPDAETLTSPDQYRESGGFMAAGEARRRVSGAGKVVPESTGGTDSQRVPGIIFQTRAGTGGPKECGCLNGKAGEAERRYPAGGGKRVKGTPDSDGFHSICSQCQK